MSQYHLLEQSILNRAVKSRMHLTHKLRQQLKFDFRIAFSRQEFYIVITIAIVLALAGFTEQCILHFGHLSFQVYSANHTSMIFTGSIGMLIIYGLLPFLAAMAYADCYYVEYTQCISQLTLSRSDKGIFLTAKFVIVAIGGLVISVLPFLINQLFCLIAFPITSAAHYSNWPSNSDVLFLATRTMLFPKLYLGTPYLANLIHILIAGLYGLLCAISTFSISLFFRRNRLIVLGLVSVVFFIGSYLVEMLGIGFVTISRYVEADNSVRGLKIEYLITVASVLLFANLSAVLVKISVFKDEI